MIFPNYFKWPGQIWIISDLHFNHGNILQFERTEFENITSHNEYLIKEINKKVNTTDTFLCLGDIGIEWRSLIERIRPGCRKILIKGNHDREANSHYTKYFDEVYDGPLFINKFLVVSHEPIPVSEHFINIHGHLHDSKLDDDNHVNVSAKMINYSPVSMSSIYENYIPKMPRIKARFLEEWYKDKYVFVNKIRKDVFFYSDTGHILSNNLIKDTLQYIKEIRPDLIKEINSSFTETGKFIKNKNLNIILDSKTDTTIETIGNKIIAALENYNETK